MTLELPTLAVILGMALVSYGTRAGGIWVTSRIRLTGRVQRFIRHLASSTLVALVTPTLVAGEAAPAAAVIVAAGVTMFTGRPALALACGIAAAVAVRALPD